ncbi:DUF1800 domain-containing protein [Spirosoma koreense]
MPYLDPYTTLLTAKTAAHLLRRATFGPTQSEIATFTGLTAAQAIQQLIRNANYSPPPPIDLDSTKPTAGQTYLDKPFDDQRNFDFGQYVRYWWLGLMTSQTAPPSLLDKLTLFWQNHFVTTRDVVEDYRYVNQYLLLLRNNALGNFRTLVTRISKEPAMLRYLNGNENEVGKPNENYARELQELFTVGAVDFAGNKNYTEDDVKAAARVLTGWKYTNYWVSGSTSFTTTFTLSKHDTGNKVFSEKYGNTVVVGRSANPSATVTAGDAELDDLVTMLLKHPQTPRFICRKLYRWYVNPNVTQAIEDNVISPLAQLFASSSNNYAIQPVIEKLLTSQVFFDDSNRASMVKSPAELAIGSMRFFNQPVPDMTTDYAAFKTYFDFMFWRMRDMQMEIVDQPSVFGYEPYYQTGFSRIWMNTTTIALRGDFTDAYIWRWLQIKPGYKMGIDLLAWATALQPNFSDVSGTPAISCADVQAAFAKNLFATDLFPSQVDFLIDTIMMQGIPRSSWTFEWNAYRTAPNDTNKRNGVTWRLQNLMKYMLRMAEYHIF